MSGSAGGKDKDNGKTTASYERFFYSRVRYICWRSHAVRFWRGKKGSLAKAEIV